VSSDGRILTNSHVVNGCSAVSVGRPGSTLQPATVIARDTKNDLALLSSQLKPERVATMRTNLSAGLNLAQKMQTSLPLCRRPVKVHYLQHSAAGFPFSSSAAVSLDQKPCNYGRLETVPQI
jgi:Trypsin-like peptidase domain